MKAIISRTELIDLIGAIQGVVPSKLALPILANILIEAFDSKLIVSATDLTISARAEKEANVVKEGAVTIPAKQFFQLVREMTAQYIELECKEGEIAYIRSGSSNFRINGICKSAFPELPHISEGLVLSLPRDTFREMMVKSLFAAAREDSRYVLNGVLMRIEHNRATFVGTDGKRLAKVCTPISIEGDHQRDYLLPLKACEEMIKMMQSEREEEVHLSLIPNKIGLKIGATTLVTLLLSGNYPDIERVIPTSSEKKFILHREELMSLLKQISLFTSKDAQSVHFIFHPGELTLTAANHEIGDGKVAMPVDYAGETFEIALNPFSLHDILRHCRDETISFQATHAHNPGLITDSSTANFVIMPMRLDVT